LRPLGLEHRDRLRTAWVPADDLESGWMRPYQDVVDLFRGVEHAHFLPAAGWIGPPAPLTDGST